MRTIDADELKVQIHSRCDVCNDKDTAWCEHCCSVNDWEDYIDNAPTIEPNDCVLKEFGKCSYKETGCSDCKIKSNLRYMCHGSAWQELQALREFKEKHEKKGKWIEHEEEKWGGVWYTCSNCHQDALYEQDVYNIWRQKLSDFCPRCGADMRGDV